MSDDRKRETGGDGDPEAETENGVTRREFMKSVGLGGAAVGLAAAGPNAGAVVGEDGTKSKTDAQITGKRLKLTMGFSDNPRLQPLKEGAVKPQNIDLEFVTISPNKLFYRNLTSGLELDVSEMSISETLLARERGEGFDTGKWDWTPIPVFLSRGLFWAALYVNTSSGIKQLGDLKGRKIGVPDYCMTAALWFKITLKDLYGIEASDNIWYNGRTK